MDITNMTLEEVIKYEMDIPKEHVQRLFDDAISTASDNISELIRHQVSISLASAIECIKDAKGELDCD
jgi:hypothetical protein